MLTPLLINGLKAFKKFNIVALQNNNIKLFLKHTLQTMHTISYQSCVRMANAFRAKMHFNLVARLIRETKMQIHSIINDHVGRGEWYALPIVSSENTSLRCISSLSAVFFLCVALLLVALHDALLVRA